MMDPESVGKEAILKVTDWLRGIWEMRRRAGPIQEWVDSIPSPTKSVADCRPVSDENLNPPSTPVSIKDGIFANPSMTVTSPIAVPGSPNIAMTDIQSPINHNRLARDPSFQSDSSHCSSVESLLEFRRADPEAILLGLGFGGCTTGHQENGPLSRIPRRFLQPSKLNGITINDFVKQQQETSESLDSASLGYRGLTGSPYVAASEIVQKIMERLREHESHEQDAYTVHNNNTEPYCPIFQDTSRLSVLSPDNRQFLERPRSKSPDMRKKRMIIGEKSFAFGCDGDLIEIDPLGDDHEADRTSAKGNNTDNHKIELDENSKTNGPKTNVIRESSYPDRSTQSKSVRVSNGRLEKRLAKQLSIDETVEDLPRPNDNSSTDDECYSRSYENSLGSSNVNEQSSQTRRNASENEDSLTNNRERRASDGFDDEKVSWSKLLREDGRRLSDSVIRQISGLSKRRKSLKRQARVSETDIVQQCCENDSNSDVFVTEKIVEHDCNDENESPDSTEITRNEAKETEKIITRSDRLSEVDNNNDCPGSGPTNVDGATNLKKKVKNRSGLAALRDLHTAVRSIRMEPGF